MSGQDGPGFLAARRLGVAPVWRIFWIDMWLVGTGFNLAASFASLLVLGLKLPLWLALAVFLSPMPWNVFLVVALWRGCEIQRPAGASAYRLGALAWLAVALLV